MVILDRADGKAARAAGGGAPSVVFGEANVCRFDVDAADIVTELGQADRQIAATAADIQDPHGRAVGEVALQNVVLGVGVDVLGFHDQVVVLSLVEGCHVSPVRGHD